MDRSLEPEWLDELPAHDPAAQASRRDLRRVNALLGHRRILHSAIAPLIPRFDCPCRVVEIGAGDATLMLGLARRLAPHLSEVELTLVDRVQVVAPCTLREFENWGWTVRLIETELSDWMDRPDPAVADLAIANLILHHFSRHDLNRLMRHFSNHSRAFVACEPRRSGMGMWGARLLGLIGCNRITRHDAVVSVRAGFQGTELSAVWPKNSAWSLRETSAGLFSHLFVAVHRANGLSPCLP